MPTLHLIDGSGYLFRAYHALPPLTTSAGVPTGAVRGVASMLLRDLRQQKPTHVAVCMDLESRVKRAEIYADYKANRPPPPEDLVPQFALVREVVRAMGVPLLELAGYEADDLIATLAREALEKGFEVVVHSGDKDLMQLVRDGHCRFYDGLKDKWFGDAEVTEKWGVPPALVGDLLALTGDKVDNVPGIPGVGDKTAAALLTEYGSLDQVLARAGDIKRPKLRDNVLAHADQVRLSRRLVALDDRAPIDASVESLELPPLHLENARPVFARLEMYSLLKELPGGNAVAQTKAPAPATEIVPEERAEAAPLAETQLVTDTDTLQNTVARYQSQERLAVLPILAGTHALTAALAGVALSDGETSAFIPTGAATLGSRALPEKTVLEALRPLLEAERPIKDGHGLKDVCTALMRRGVRLNGLGLDVESASFLINSARREHQLVDLARERLSLDLPLPPQDGRKSGGVVGASPEELARWAGPFAQAVVRLVPLLQQELTRNGLDSLWTQVERPVIAILSDMELTGILVDGAALRAQSAGFESALVQLAADMEQLAGRPFNVNSPSQLAEVLFETLKLPVVRRGKTGPSTDAEVLEQLSEQHPLPGKVLEYRSISKLKNTYLDTLPEQVAADGRIHTTLHPLGAATGRISSNDPNLQNIPIRTELGRRIRQAFVAPPGCVLVSADYSQVELRILAHVSGDAALADSFRRGEDVHRRTASEIYGTSPEDVTDEMRRVAKMVNYAITYGLSAFGLSSRLNMPRDEAKRVIEAYFQRYAGIKAWLDETVRHGREQGYVSTLLGRRRQMADLRSKNPALRQAAERAAVNAPIQGTAADIVKQAMVAVDRMLRAQLPSARMLLQVHDELLFEVPEADAPALGALVKPVMEQAVALSVPLVVDVGQGRSWAEAH